VVFEYVHMRISQLFFTLVAALSFFGNTLVAQEGDVTRESIRVLGIGNSFTRDAFHYLQQISDASTTHEIIFVKADIGGCPLSKHAALLKENEADPSAGLSYSTPGKKERVGLKAVLESQAWDIVSIQQLSRESATIETYRPYAAELQAAVATYAPQAELVFHQTWAYRIDGDFAKTWPDRKDYDQTAMYRDSCSAYHQIASELGGLRIIANGAAFQLARERRPFVVAPTSSADLVEPELPDQTNSLNVGWFWNKGKLGHDTHHASAQGRLLGGLVWYAFLTGQDPRTLKLTIDGISAEDIQFLQTVAHDVVLDGQRPAIQPD
jgi:hypothetical protein